MVGPALMGLAANGDAIFIKRNKASLGGRAPLAMLDYFGVWKRSSIALVTLAPGIALAPW